MPFHLKTKEFYEESAEIEYRLAGLFFALSKEKYGFHHLIAAMKIDYDYHVILKELFPTVLDDEKVQKLLVGYKKALDGK